MEQIDFSKSAQYTLSIRLSADGFSFSIYNPISDHSLNYLPLEVDTHLPLTVNLRELMKSDFFRYDYKRVNVLLVSHRFTPCPGEFVQDEHLFDRLLNANHPRRENEVVLCNELGKADVGVVFGMDRSGWMSISERYPEVRFYAHVSPLLEFFAGKSRMGNSRKMYAYLRPGYVDVCCFERGRLLLANSYVASRTGDVLYYLLYIGRQLGYDAERDELHLAGNMVGRDDLLAELRSYVRQVFVVNPRSEYNPSASVPIEEVPFDLQSLFLCEI